MSIIKSALIAVLSLPMAVFALEPKDVELPILEKKVLSPADLYEKSIKSIVTVRTATINPHNMTMSPGLGSAFHIGDGMFVTAAHVVKDVVSIKMKFSTGDVSIATLAAYNDAADIALLKTNRHFDAPELDIADTDGIRIGEITYVIGSPYGNEGSLSSGFLSQKIQRGQFGNGEKGEFLQTDASINPGNSGGPMFNEKGEVIGVVSFILTKDANKGSNGIGFAVSGSTVKRFIKYSSALNGGIQFNFLPAHVAKLFNMPHPGAIITEVFPNSVAKRIGIKQGYTKVTVSGSEYVMGGDMIMEINGQKCEDNQSFLSGAVCDPSILENGLKSVRVFRKGDGEILMLAPKKDKDLASTE